MLLKLTKKRIPLFITIILGVEALIFLYAVWRTEPEFVFDKCARFSGRASSEILLIILLMVGYYGLKKIYSDDKKKDAFRILITLFAANHLVHLLYVVLNFKTHAKPLTIHPNLHGFITFICLLIMPFILWTFKKLNGLLYVAIILHLFNVSYFINETFLSKVKPGIPAYHNQFGVLVITLACLYILYRFIKENRRNQPVGEGSQLRV